MAVKLISVRMTAFEDAASEGGSASVESVAAAGDPGISSFVGQDLTVSDCHKCAARPCYTVEAVGSGINGTPIAAVC